MATEDAQNLKVPWRSSPKQLLRTIKQKSTSKDGRRKEKKRKPATPTENIKQDRKYNLKQNYGPRGNTITEQKFKIIEIHEKY